MPMPGGMAPLAGGMALVGWPLLLACLCISCLFQVDEMECQLKSE